MAKKLLLITAKFPFGSGETFLETEVHYLADAFERVQIVPIERVTGEPRMLPSNVSIIVLNSDSQNTSKLILLTSVFNRDFFRELLRILFVYRLVPSPQRIKTALVSLFRGKQLSNWLEHKLKERSETVLYSYWCNDAAIGLSLYKRKNSSMRTVTRAHGWDLYFEASSIHYLPYRNMITDQLDLVCPVSEVGVRYVGEKWKCKNKVNIQLARLGVEAQNPPTTQPELFTVVSCSNLIPLKRVHLIIEALSLFTEVPIRWIHFGDGPLSKELCDLAERILPPNISWKFMGRIPNQDLLQWYRGNPVSVFINVSETEGIPVSIMEAMSLGIPVLATAVGGTPEIVSEEVGSLLPKELLPEDLKKALEKMIMLSANEWQQLAQQAFTNWQENYNAEKNYRSFVAWLREI